MVKVPPWSSLKRLAMIKPRPNPCCSCSLRSNCIYAPTLVTCSVENPRPRSVIERAEPGGASVRATRTGEPGCENLKAFCTTSSTILARYSSEMGNGRSVNSKTKSEARLAVWACWRARSWISLAGDRVCFLTKACAFLGSAPSNSICA